MLEEAKKTGLYHALIPGDPFLQSSLVYDLITALEVLIYRGDLQGILSQFHRALAPEGWLIFSYEEGTDDRGNTPFRLNPTGRYSHQGSYIGDLLKGLSFQIREQRSCISRTENRTPVKAGLVLCQKI
jgi:predicted TPR repeat methyltransferase